MNPRAKSDQYPVPKTEDLLATVSGGQKFTKLNLTGAYHQLLLEEESRMFDSEHAQGIVRTNQISLRSAHGIGRISQAHGGEA